MIPSCRGRSSLEGTWLGVATEHQSQQADIFHDRAPRPDTRAVPLDTHPVPVSAVQRA